MVTMPIRTGCVMVGIPFQATMAIILPTAALMSRPPEDRRMYNPTDLPAWKALQAHQGEIAPVHMRDLFRDDPRRFERFSLRYQDILLDFSKNRITGKTLSLLLDLAR